MSPHLHKALACTQRGFTNIPSRSPCCLPFKKERFVSEVEVERGQEGSWKLLLRWACCEDGREGFRLQTGGVDTVQGMVGKCRGWSGTVDNLKWQGQAQREPRQAGARPSMSGLKLSPMWHGNRNALK